MGADSCVFCATAPIRVISATLRKRCPTLNRVSGWIIRILSHAPRDSQASRGSSLHANLPTPDHLERKRKEVGKSVFRYREFHPCRERSHQIASDVSFTPFALKRLLNTSTICSHKRKIRGCGMWSGHTQMIVEKSFCLHRN